MLNVDDMKEKAFRLNNNPYQKIVAALVILGKSEYFGYNMSSKSHPQMLRTFRNGQFGACTHAEVSALNKVPRQSRHLATIFVARWTKDGTLTMARPCYMCQDFLSINGLNRRNIWYSNWEGGWDCLHDR